jgi:hypothetical protein
MPVSKTRKKPARCKPKKAAQPLKQSMPVMAAAGSYMPLMSIRSAIQEWKSGSESLSLDEGCVGAFFFTYDRVLKNAGIPFDIRPAEQVLNRIQYRMPIGLEELELLHAEGQKLMRLVAAVNDTGAFFESLTDAEIYGHVHNWEWRGIGKAPAGVSAGA